MQELTGLQLCDAVQMSDAALSQLLHQQQHVLTSEQLATLSAAAGQGIHIPLPSAAEQGTLSSMVPTDIQLPPAPDLQGTSIAFLDSTGVQPPSSQALSHLQGLGEQQLVALAGGVGGLPGLTGLQRPAGECA